MLTFLLFYFLDYHSSTLLKVLFQDYIFHYKTLFDIFDYHLKKEHYLVFYYVLYLMIYNNLLNDYRDIHLDMLQNYHYHDNFE